MGEIEIMRNIPVDASRVQFLFAGSVMPKPFYDADRNRVEGRQATDDAGQPLWVIDCMVPGDDGQRAEVVGVTVPCAYQPTLRALAPVQFEGLIAKPYARDGRVQTSFTAAAVAKESMA